MPFRSSNTDRSRVRSQPRRSSAADRAAWR
jgi:hypothetical protein